MALKDVEIRERREALLLDPSVELIDALEAHIGARLRTLTVVEPDLARLDRREELPGVREEAAGEVPVQAVAHGFEPSIRESTTQVISQRTMQLGQ